MTRKFYDDTDRMTSLTRDEVLSLWRTYNFTNNMGAFKEAVRVNDPRLYMRLHDNVMENAWMTFDCAVENTAVE